MIAQLFVLRTSFCFDDVISRDACTTWGFVTWQEVSQNNTSRFRCSELPYLYVLISCPGLRWRIKRASSTCVKHEIPPTSKPETAVHLRFGCAALDLWKSNTRCLRCSCFVCYAVEFDPAPPSPLARHPTPAPPPPIHRCGDARRINAINPPSTSRKGVREAQGKRVAAICKAICPAAIDSYRWTNPAYSCRVGLKWGGLRSRSYSAWTQA